MADDTVLIAIKAIDDASKVIASVGGTLDKLDQQAITAGKGLISVNDALVKLIQQERVAKTMDDARAALSLMNDEEKDAILKAHDLTEAQATLSGAQNTLVESTKKSAQGFESLKGTLVSVQAGIGIAKEAIAGIKGVYDDTIGKTIEYAERVKDLSEVLSLSSEETSKLISIGQKFGVSTDTLTASLQMMTKRGMAPTLEGLAEIADKTMAIKDPVQRSAMLVELFGRNWTALFPILEKGGAAIRAAGDEASRFGKVLSQEDVDAAEKFSIAANTLGQDFDGLKVKMTKGLIPELIKSVEDFTYFIDKVQGTVTPLEDAKRTLDRVTAAFGENSPAAIAARKAYEDLRAELERDATAVKNFKNSIGAGFITDTAVNAAKELRSGIAQIVNESKRASSSGLVDYILAEEGAMKKAADASQMLADKNLALLKIGVSGQLAKETKQFTQSQTDLQKRLKETAAELATLEGKQGAVDKTTVKNAMSANQLKLAYAQLAAMQGRLSKETDPTKQAELAAQIGIQQDRINGANSAVSSYIDNSKRIEQLKGTYDDLTTQVEANARAHDEASKRILFDYAQQAIAQENARNGIAGMTEDQVNALNKLAVTWKIKSQADVDAMNQMLLAAKNLAQNNNLDQFAAVAQGALEGPKKPTDELIARMQTMQKEAGDKMPKVAKSIGEVKQPTKDLVTQMRDLQTNALTGGMRLQAMNQYGVIPLTKAFDMLNMSVGAFNTLIGQMPTTIPIPTPTTPTTTPVRTYPLPGGAAKGANYIVPPGYPNDTYYQRVSSGEHVQVTPQGKSSMNGLNISKVEINVGGTNATIPQIQQAVWTEMTRVIEAASR